jgi:hypothetical protein
VDSPREHGRTGGVRVVLLAPPALDLGPVSARLAAKIGGELIDGAAAGGSEEGGGGLQGAVGFVSDLTGDWEEWKRLVAFSSVLAWDEAGAGADGTDAVRLLPGAEFVFGGNLLGARGDGSGLRLARSLLALRRRYPGRVHFLIGARDVPPRPASAAARLAAPHRNALTGARVQVALLRLTSELSAAAIADPHVLTDGSFPYWVGAARPSCRRPVALRRRCARGGGGGAERGRGVQVRHEDRVTPAQFLARALKRGGAAEGENSTVNRLRWMLEETMDAPSAFEARRAELGALAPGSAPASDEDVAASFLDTVTPAAAAEGAAGGAGRACVLEYLAAATVPPPPPPRTKWTRRVPHPVLIGHAGRCGTKVAHVHGAALFVHGAVSAEALGCGAPAASPRAALPRRAAAGCRGLTRGGGRRAGRCPGGSGAAGRSRCWRGWRT